MKLIKVKDVKPVPPTPPSHKPPASLHIPYPPPPLLDIELGASLRNTGVETQEIFR